MRESPEPRHTTPFETLARDFVVVLFQTQDLVNIAGTIRAMLNMGLLRLRLVQPAEYDEHRICGITHFARPVLDRVEFYDSLSDAVADCVHVVGTTARRRTSNFVWDHPRDAAPELLELAGTGAGPVALVFGREDFGLPNADLDRCDRVLTIPVDEQRGSLNLFQAVLIVCYELRMAISASHPLPRPRRTAPPATTAALDTLFRESERTLQEIDFFKGRNPSAIMRTLRAVARRANLDAREAKLLLALAYEVRKSYQRALEKGAAKVDETRSPE
ncbi:MAG TPA: TrmH family RNA methyltransferase [Longimicrobiales bacterium]|nr:TrmH family RNA methyltransferase [Longimicrobiales bacterium]